MTTESTLVYAGFWRRFGAYWIDAIVLLPLVGLTFLLSGESNLFYAYNLIPSALIGVAFYVHLVYKFGGTPGKLVLETRIFMKDGSPVTLEAAALRYCVLGVLSLLSSLGGALAALNIPNSQLSPWVSWSAHWPCNNLPGPGR